MTWRVLTTPSSEPDFRALTAQDRASVIEDLFAWVEDGPTTLWPPVGPGSRALRRPAAVRVHDQLLRE
ncbi:MAG: hypothetical protein ACRDV9_06615 [Acidimicrobiia bacterium]